MFFEKGGQMFPPPFGRKNQSLVFLVKPRLENFKKIKFPLKLAKKNLVVYKPLPPKFQNGVIFLSPGMKFFINKSFWK